jgi:hypothetical protein
VLTAYTITDVQIRELLEATGASTLEDRRLRNDCTTALFDLSWGYCPAWERRQYENLRRYAHERCAQALNNRASYERLY